MCGMFVTGLPLPEMTIIILILTVFSQDSFVIGEYRRILLLFPVEVGSHHKRFRSLILLQAQHFIMSRLLSWERRIISWESCGRKCRILLRRVRQICVKRLASALSPHSLSQTDGQSDTVNKLGLLLLQDKVFLRARKCYNLQELDFIMIARGVVSSIVAFRITKWDLPERIKVNISNLELIRCCYWKQRSKQRKCAKRFL